MRCSVSEASGSFAITISKSLEHTSCRSRGWCCARCRCPTSKASGCCRRRGGKEGKGRANIHGSIEIAPYRCLFTPYPLFVALSPPSGVHKRGAISSGISLKREERHVNKRDYLRCQTGATVAGAASAAISREPRARPRACRGHHRPRAAWPVALRP